MSAGTSSTNAAEPMADKAKRISSVDRIRKIFDYLRQLNEPAREQEVGNHLVDEGFKRDFGLRVPCCDARICSKDRGC